MHPYLSYTLAERALQLAANPDRKALLPLLATNLAVMLSKRRGDDPIIAVIGDDNAIGARAFRFGARLYGRAQDDWYHRGRVHLGTAVIPGLLALDIDDVIPALAAGFGAMMTVSAAYGTQAHTHALRPASIFSPIGTSVAAGVGLGLDLEGLAKAISFALVGSCGHSQCMLEGTDEWRYEVLLGIRAGAEAAQLAQAGVAAARATFEGKAGWCLAHFDDGEARSLGDVLNEPPESPSVVSVKPYPGSGVAMATIVTAVDAGKRTGRAMPDVFKLYCSPAIVAVPGSVGKPPYVSAVAAGMSLTHCAAKGYLTGTMTRWPDGDIGAEVDALDRMIELCVDPELEDGTARVEVTIGGATTSVTGAADHLLYPTWDELAADPERLAQSYEAPRQAIEALLDLLGQPEIPSGAIRALLEE